MISRQARREATARMPPADMNIQQAYVWWMAPVFTGNESCYFTGTYNDVYGHRHGMTHVGNVHEDVRRFLRCELQETGRRYVCGVERHRWRDILHWHGIIEGPVDETFRRWLKQWWALDRGFARALPVQDGCASYITKYALKGDADWFDFRGLGLPYRR